MTTHWKRLLILITPSIFLIGLWWGLRGHFKTLSSRFTQAESFKIWAPPHFFTPALLKNLSQELDFKVEVTEVTDLRNLLPAVEQPLDQVDALIFYSPQANPHHSKSQFYAFPRSEVKSLIALYSSDFINGPYNAETFSHFPIGWDVMGLYLKENRLKPGQMSFKQGLLSAQAKSLALPFDASTLLSFMQHTGRLQSEWIEPESADLVKSTFAKIFPQLELYNPMTVQWSTLENKEALIAPWASQAVLEKLKFKWVWPEEGSDIWVSYFALKNTKKRDQMKDLLATLLENPKNYELLLEASHQRSTQKKGGQGAELQSDFLRTLPLSKMKLLIGLPTGTLIWDKAFEHVANGGAVEDIEAPSNTSAGDDI